MAGLMDLLGGLGGGGAGTPLGGVLGGFGSSGGGFDLSSLLGGGGASAIMNLLKGATPQPQPGAAAPGMSPGMGLRGQAGPSAQPLPMPSMNAMSVNNQGPQGMPGGQPGMPGGPLSGMTGGSLGGFGAGMGQQMMPWMMRR